MALPLYILVPLLILGTTAQRGAEKHQLVGAFRGMVISVHEKIPLELCSVHCSMDTSCEAYEYNVSDEGTCHLLNKTSSAAKTVLSDGETRVYVKEVELLRDPNRIRPEFYEDFEDVNGIVFHNGAELANGKFDLAANTYASQSQWIDLGDLSQYSCILKPSLCGATGGGSINVWIKTQDCPRTERIITSLNRREEGFSVSKANDDETYRFQMIRHDMYYVGYDQIPDDTWFQVVMTFRDEPNAELRVHVNSVVRQATARGTAHRGENTSGHVVIGRRHVEKDSGYCSAMVDELMLWNRSLTIQEAEYFISLY